MRVGRRDLDALPDDKFRRLWRAWLQANYPERWRVPFLRLVAAEERSFIRLLYEGGWRAPAWPIAEGGLGLSLRKQLIYQDELERHGAARIADLGATLLAPTLMRFGTDEQKRVHLPGILTGEHLWCQGYSEPGAGSDLAGLRTAARRDGDELVINGQKIWTSMAAVSDRIFMLVRTSRHARKQDGITFLVADLDRPGITVRPIQNIAGDREFCEVFFDDVRVPVGSVIGALDGGWSVAKALLGVERIVTGSPTLAKRAFQVLMRVAAAVGADHDGASGERLARLACDLADVTSLYRDISEAAIAGAVDEMQLSLLKIATSELFQRISEALIEISAEHGAAAGPVAIGGRDEDIHRIFMIARAATIYGGAGEVQRDIVARALLGPVRPRPDTKAIAPEGRTATTQGDAS